MSLRVSICMCVGNCECVFAFEWLCAGFDFVYVFACLCVLCLFFRLILVSLFLCRFVCVCVGVFLCVFLFI